jgi:hypothetical protein
LTPQTHQSILHPLIITIVLNESTELQDPKDLFDVRLKILRYTNPLRAKILIFSLLYHPFKFSTRDWLTIKMQDLDNLIRHLYSICSTPVELKSRLYEITQKLNHQEEDFTTAIAIYKAMKSLYENFDIEEANPISPGSDHHLNSAIDQIKGVPASNESDEIEENLPNPIPDNDEIQLFDPGKGNLPFDKPSITSLSPPNLEDQSNSQFDEDDSHIQPLFLYDLDDFSETISYDPGNQTPEKLQKHPPNIQDLDDLGERGTPNTRDPSSDSPKSASNVGNDPLNITASLLRTLNLDDDVRYTIDEQAHKVRETLIEAVQHLEQKLDRILLEESPSDRISIKYPALQKLTDTLFKHLSQVQDILVAQAQAAMAAPPLTPAPSQNSSSTPMSAIPQEIVALLNPVLKPQGIKTLVKKKEKYLHIVFESERTLNPQKLITFVHAALLEVNLEAIDRIKVYSRKPGNQSPDWIQTIHLNTDR